MPRGVPRFDWRKAIVTCAFEVESAVRMARESRRYGMPHDLEAAARYDREAASKARYAEWLARSYGWRYGPRTKPATTGATIDSSAR